MKLCIELPTWLGDAVMCTPAIENIVAQYPQCRIILLGSYVSTKLFLNHPNIEKIIVDESKKKGLRYVNLYRISQEIGKVDMAISFRKNFSTRFLFFFIQAKQKYIYQKCSIKQIHQVIRYNDFINRSLMMTTEAKDLKIYVDEERSLLEAKPLLGINPGATYGSAKRWYPESFAKVSVALSKEYDIVLFGGPDEIGIAKDIEDILKKEHITNYSNLAGKTSVEELLINIATLSLFITADSGPMHIAAAFRVPTVALFGPTKDYETSQWQNPKGVIVKKKMDCAPCMQRRCPLKHHECMKNISPQDVLEAVKTLDLA
jgi:heptosyltransferase-2